MNNSYFESHWQELKSYILKKWDRLTEEDLRQVGGRVEQFLTKLQEKYNYTRAQAEEEFRDWKPTVKSDDTVAGATGTPSWLPWALIGIPLLLFLGYLGNRDTTTRDVPTAPRTTQEVPATIGAASDRTIAQTIRDMIDQNQTLSSKLSNLKVESNDGVVTIRGTAPSAIVKDQVTTIAENVSTVKKV